MMKTEVWTRKRHTTVIKLRQKVMSNKPQVYTIIVDVGYLEPSCSCKLVARNRFATPYWF